MVFTISTKIHKRRQIEKEIEPSNIICYGHVFSTMYTSFPREVDRIKSSIFALYTLDLVCSAIISVLNSPSSVHWILIWMPTRDSINASLIDAYTILSFGFALSGTHETNSSLLFQSITPYLHDSVCTEKERENTTRSMERDNQCEIALKWTNRDSIESPQR